MSWMAPSGSSALLRRVTDSSPLEKVTMQHDRCTQVTVLLQPYLGSAVTSENAIVLSVLQVTKRLSSPRNLLPRSALVNGQELTAKWLQLTWQP